MIDEEYDGDNMSMKMMKHDSDGDIEHGDDESL